MAYEDLAAQVDQASNASVHLKATVKTDNVEQAEAAEGMVRGLTAYTVTIVRAARFKEFQDACTVAAKIDGKPGLRKIIKTIVTSGIAEETFRRPKSIMKMEKVETRKMRITLSHQYMQKGAFKEADGNPMRYVQQHVESFGVRLQDSWGWQRLRCSDGNYDLGGLIRVKARDWPKVLEESGSAGVFSDGVQIPLEEQKPLWAEWVEINEQEQEPDRLIRAMTLKAEWGLVLGRNGIGVRRPVDDNTTIRRMWMLEDVDRAWSSGTWPALSRLPSGLQKSTTEWSHLAFQGHDALRHLDTAPAGHGGKRGRGHQSA